MSVNKKFLFLLFQIVFTVNSFGQTDELDLLSPSKQIIRKAKSETSLYLKSVRDSMGFSKRDIKLRKFELDYIIDDQLGKESATDKSDLSKTSKDKTNDPILYKFTHKTNNNGSGYTYIFYYNQYGNLVKKEVAYYLIVR